MSIPFAGRPKVYSNNLPIMKTNNPRTNKTAAAMLDHAAETKLPIIMKNPILRIVFPIFIYMVADFS